MKRMLCLLLCAVLLLASCGSKMPAQAPMPELAGSPELSMEVVSTESTWRKKTVTVRLTNRMDHTLLYGRTYQLLRYDGTTWENATKTPSLWDRTFPPVACVLKSGESREITFTLTTLHFVDIRKPYCLTMRFFEEKGDAEYICGVLLEPGAWQ